MPRIFFVNRFFHPDFSATSQLLTDLAVHLARQGRPVTVITSRLSYDDPSQFYAPRETVQGVEVVRVKTTRFGRGHMLGRALDYLGFYLSASWALLRHVRPGDVVVAKTDPPLISIAVAAAARLKGARLVNWLQDVFPETAMVLGVRLLAGPAGRVLAGLRNLSLRAAVANVVLGRKMAAHVERMRVPPARISIIPNWADDVDIVPTSFGANPLRAAWSWQDRFVAAYSGNLGRAHEVETFLGAARALAGESLIGFAFIGGGAKLAQAREYVLRHGLNNVVFLPYQPREQLAASLGAANLHLVSLLPELENFIFPSKLYGVLAAGRPVAFVGSPDGEIGGLLRRADCGAAFACGDVAGLAAYIRLLAAQPAEAERLGNNARSFLERELTQARSLAAWSAVLDRVGAGHL